MRRQNKFEISTIFQLFFLDSFTKWPAVIYWYAKNYFLCWLIISWFVCHYNMLSCSSNWHLLIGTLVFHCCWQKLVTEWWLYCILTDLRPSQFLFSWNVIQLCASFYTLTNSCTVSVYADSVLFVWPLTRHNRIWWNAQNYNHTKFQSVLIH